MTTKNYIGKGKVNSKFNTINIGLNVEKLKELMETSNPEHKILFLEIAEMKEKDQYGNTHTIYKLNSVAETPTTANEPEPDKKKKKK